MSRFPGVAQLAHWDAAVMIIDVQNDYCHEAGTIGRHIDREAIAGMVDGVVRLRSAARRAGVPVVFVRTVHSPLTDTPSWLQRQGNDQVCRAGSFGAEFYRVEPGSDDIVVTKHRYSGFIGTPLEQVLRSRGIDALVVAGIGSNVCVESTVRDAYMLDFNVIVVRDATTGEADLHEPCLEGISRHFGSVTTVDEVARVWAVPATTGGGR
jgi:ureidoacrylate peracid hydrolase